MTTLVFDIEADGFLEDCTKVHCLAIHRVGDDKGTLYADHNGYPSIKEGLKVLSQATQIIAHNGIKYDLPVLHKLFGFTVDESKVLDTLVLSRLIFSDLYKVDEEKREIPQGLYGRHSLEAWGNRLGEYKGDYQGPWDAFSEEMARYCLQDVNVTVGLYLYLKALIPSEMSLTLEHQVQWIIAQQERNGVGFDERKAGDLLATLTGKYLEIERELAKVFKPWYLKDKEVVPKVNNKTKGITKGVPYTSVKLITFNPSSRDHIANRLVKIYGWNPDKFTKKGRPEVNEETLKSLKAPCRDLFIEYLLIEKRLGLLKGWLESVRNGRIHGAVITNGAVTGRATHTKPNIAQVPAVRSPYGRECRDMFVASKGKVLVGTDLSGIELRALAHYMAKDDGGKYGEMILNGDIHTVNQEAAGLPTRDMAKTFIYGFLYGAGDSKIGSITGKGAEAGRKLRKRFLAGLPALDKLTQRVKRSVSLKGSLPGLDGRTLPIRSEHSALNTLLQSAGALISKQWMVEVHKQLKETGINAKQVLWVHDELLFECSPGDAERLKEICLDSARKAGEFFNFRIRIDAEAKIGNTWGEVH
jgi:DNA polymerase-1